MTDPAAVLPSFDVVTEQVDPITSLLPLLDARHPLLFMRRGEGIAGIGEAARLEFHGPDRLRRRGRDLEAHRRRIDGPG